MLILWELFFLALLGGGPVGLTAYYRKRYSEPGDEFTPRWLKKWFFRGVAAPAFVWVLLNAGRMPYMPPLTKYVGRLRGRGATSEAFFVQVIYGVLTVISWWAALSMLWWLGDLFRRARNREDLAIALMVWLPVLAPIFLVFYFFGGWGGAGFALLIWVWPFTQYCLGVAQVGKPPPAYSKAIGKIKFGKYAEAEMAIISELEKSETNFDGWMMLAELYARQFNDVAEAEKTVLELCAEPTTTISQISIALHKLADWHLNAGDPVAARRVLEDLCERMPGTHLALVARQRLAQLPQSHAEMVEQQKPRTFAMPVLNETLNESAKDEPISPETAMAAATRLVEKLTLDPNDTASREKLARVFAEQLGKVELALEQVTLLMGMPGQPPANRAEWLALTAAWTMKLRGEGEEAERLLERLVGEFPMSPQAFAAQRRLALMRMDAKLKRRGLKVEDAG